MGPPEPYGPFPIESPSPAPQEIYGPTQIQLRPVVLVLGPGMARGFAFAGVLRALHESKIPIGAIIGTEMGGFLGALYAVDGNINHFEWALMKFREDVFQADRKILSRLLERDGANTKLDMSLSQVFGAGDLGASKIPVRILVEHAQTAQPALIEKGEARLAIGAAMAGTAATALWEGVSVRSAARSRPFPVAEARALGVGPVIAINVVPELRSHKDLAEADLVIEPDMRGIGAADYAKRTEAAFRGKKAIKERLREIRHWVGLPEDEADAGGNGK